MEIRNVIKFKTPLGFNISMYVSDGEIRRLIDSHILDSWNYHIVLYGCPLIQEFVYSITDFDYSNYLAFQSYLYSQNF